MRIKRILFILCLLLLAGGVFFLSTSEIGVKQTEVRKEIPNERFFKD